MLKRQSRLHLEIFDTGALIVDLVGNRMHQTNHVGRRILEILVVPRTRDEIISTLAAEYDVDMTVLTEDIDEFLEILTKNDWLE